MRTTMADYDLKTLEGVFAYSAVAGILLSVWIYTGIDVSETGIAIIVLETFSNVLGSPWPYLVPTISITVTVIEILIMAYYAKQITEHGMAGIVASVGGFFGSLSLFLGSFSGLQLFVYLGITLWFIGALVPPLLK